MIPEFKSFWYLFNTAFQTYLCYTSGFTVKTDLISGPPLNYYYTPSVFVPWARLNRLRIAGTYLLRTY